MCSLAVIVVFAFVAAKTESHILATVAPWSRPHLKEFTTQPNESVANVIINWNEIHWFGKIHKLFAVGVLSTQTTYINDEQQEVQ